MWDGRWLLLDAWGTGWAVHGAVGSSADFFGAVDTISSVVTVAGWEWPGGFNNDWGPLGELSLLWGHTDGEELGVGWSAGDAIDLGVQAGADFEETGIGW